LTELPHGNYALSTFYQLLIRHRTWLLAAGAGGVLALAFPKFSLAGFAWIAPALMLAAAHGKSGGAGFRIGCVSGLVFWLVSLSWLLLMPATGFPILGWLALAGYVALYFGAWVGLVAPDASQAGPAGMNGLLDKWIDEAPHPSTHPPIHSSTHPIIHQPANPPIPLGGWPRESWSGRTLWALGGAAVWVALEMVRARLFGGFPWSFLGVSQYQYAPLIQLAAVTGVYGVSFLIVWFSLSLYSAARMILLHPAKRQVWQVEIVLPLSVVIGCYVGGFLAMQRPVPTENYVRVTAIQPSVPQTLIWNSDENVRRFQALLELSQRALADGTNASDLLVWPESAVPDIDEPTYEAINQFVRSNHVWLVLNGEDVEIHPPATNFFNAAFLIGPDGRWRQAYHKRQLVIFGEYVPLANWLPFLKWLTPITGGWTPGDRPGTFSLERRLPPSPAGVIQITPEPAAGDSATVNCAPLICFEDTFPGAARDSAQPDEDFLVNLTNDGWFKESAEQWQHLANAVFRAVENGLPLLRCANNGVTCLINRHGRVVTTFRDGRNSEYGRGWFTVDIPLVAAGQKSEATHYRRHGDWFGWGCVAVTVVSLTTRIRRLKKSAL